MHLWFLMWTQCLYANCLFRSQPTSIIVCYNNRPLMKDKFLLCWIVPGEFSFTREIIGPKNGTQPHIYSKNENLMLIARYGAFVLNFNQEPQHRTQQSMCNSHFFHSPKAVYSFSTDVVFYGSLESLNHFWIFIILLHILCQSQKRGFKNLSQLLM